LAQAQSPPPVAFGAETQNGQDYFLIHDFSESNLLHTDQFGLQRYGFGRGQFEIGKLSQIYAENRSGVLLGSGLVKVGLEPFAGKISYQNSPYYQWEPGVSVGLADHSGTFAYYVGPRAGVSYSTSGNDNFAGAVASVQYGVVQTSYIVNNYWISGNHQEITDLLVNNKYNLQYQNTSQNGVSYMVGVRFGM